MKINEVEALVGITKKNIRFYEEQGLLSPRRNSQNGYREYGEEEVEILQRIKLMRKLGVPLEEIRKMQAGPGTVADGMRRHLVTLERQRKNLEQATALCRSLQDREVRLDALDARTLLEEMERMEREGTTFQNRQQRDVRPARYVPPVVAAVLMTLILLAAMAVLFWSWHLETDPSGPLPLVILMMGVLLLVMVGVWLALLQRIREIQKGEMDDAKGY